MRRVLAGAVMGAMMAGVTVLTGAAVRGDWQGQELARDLIAGLAVFGGVAVAQWAARELDGGEADSDR